MEELRNDDCNAFVARQQTSSPLHRSEIEDNEKNENLSTRLKVSPWITDFLRGIFIIMREECKHGRMFRGLITFPRTNQPRFALFFSSSFFPSQLKTMISRVNRCPRCIFKLIIQSVDSFHFSAESEGSTRVRRKSIVGNLVRASVRNVLTYLISVECILGIETKFRKFPVKLLYFLDNRYLLL